MKSIIYTFLFGACCLILLQSFDTKSLNKRADGTNPGFTGSPGDSLKNCTVCHGGTATPVIEWITSDIPTAGFKPGNTYKITATNTSLSHNRFGFSISPQAIDGRMLGTLVVTDTGRTQINGNGKYITYKPAGVPGQNMAVWEFNWIAPTDGTKEVVFYGAFNSNQDGHKGGDLTQLSTLRVYQEGFTSLNELNVGLNLSIYPNPSSDYLNLELNKLDAGETVIKLFTLNGKEVLNLMSKNLPAGITKEQINISQIESGIYLVQTVCGNQTSTQKLVVFH
jgi:hypothetical protein